MLYGLEQNGTLDKPQVTYISSTVCVHPRTLPPTSGAAKFYRLCVYHQVQELPAEQWMDNQGW